MELVMPEAAELDVITSELFSSERVAKPLERQ